MPTRRSVARKASILLAIAAGAVTAVMTPSVASAATPGSAFSIVKSPNVTTGNFATNFLTGVSAVSDSDVWAVGYDNKTGANPDGNFPLIEHWNGTAWSVALNGTQNAMFNAVSADSSSDAWAVGNVLNSHALLAEHWNGSAWTVAAMPEPADAISASIEGVTALSATNAYAVGTYSNNDLNLPLIEHWNGTAWSVMPNVPREVSESNDLHAVTAISPSDIWAVGEFFQGGEDGGSQLLMHWNGTAWSLANPAQINANGGESDAFPVAVTATASNDVWAVGGADVTNQDGVTSQQPFSEHWDGTQWTEVATPAPATISASFSFSSAAALSPTDVWAVGVDTTSAFIEHWNGSTWSTASTPALGADGSDLAGITKSGATSMWAVGDNQPKSTLISQSLTLHATKG